MKHILCFGDSNTWGFNPANCSRYPWGVRWTSILQEKLNNQNVRIIEEGLCGRTTVFEDAYRENKNGIKALPLILDTYKPLDGAVIMLGTNDCKSFFGLSAYQIAKGMEECIDKILTLVPADNILLISPILLGEKVWLPDFDPEFNKESVGVAKQLFEEYKNLAERKNIHILDASKIAIPSEIDQEHLTAEGHADLAEAVYKALVKTGIGLD